MPRWDHRIELHAVLSRCTNDFDLNRVEEPCPEEVKAALVAEISKATPLLCYCGPIQAAGSIAEVNRILGVLFDRADRFRVWCGMPE